MFWSRLSRVCLLICVWVAGLYAILAPIFLILKNKYITMQAVQNVQAPALVASADPATPIAVAETLPTFHDVSLFPVAAPRRKNASSRLVVQRNASLVLVGVLLTAVIVQFVLGLRNTGSPLASKTVISAAVKNTPTQSSTATPAGTHAESFEGGIVTPQWQQQNAYGPTWQTSLDDIKTQAGAGWIEFSLLFSQTSSSSTTVLATQSTPLATALASGIRMAHAKGFRVFVVPLMMVNEPGGWAGSIQFSNAQDEQAWFNSYWNTYQPYVLAAAQEGADQLAIGTECAWLQQHAPPALWTQLIDRIRSVYTGTLTYDMNWYPLDQPVPQWYANTNISMIGVSAYMPLTSVSIRIDPAVMPNLWRDKIKTQLDALSTRINKPVLISEIGYRNTSDALYNTWVQDSTLPADNEEQTAAYNAALTNVVSDPHIAGIFFWGWTDVGRFSIKGQPVLSVLHKWFTGAA